MLHIKQIFAAPGGPWGPGRLTHAAPRHDEDFHDFGAEAVAVSVAVAVAIAVAVVVAVAW